jgi:HAD superfamily phosphatase (TIGR01668 family)
MIWCTPLQILYHETLDTDYPQEHFQRLREAYPGRKLLIVSNTAGALSLDPSGKLAATVEKSTGITVLPHSDKKPGCGAEIMAYFRKYPETGVTRPDQIAVVGDRLTTDVLMANMMGSYAIWVKDGVVPPEETSVVRCPKTPMITPLTIYFEVRTLGAEIRWSSATERQ